MAFKKTAAVASPRQSGSKPKAKSAGPINRNEVYSLDDFLRRVRWSRTALKTAVRNGLVTTLAGNICYVLGSDFACYLETIAYLDKLNAKNAPEVVTMPEYMAMVNGDSSEEADGIATRIEISVDLVGPILEALSEGKRVHIQDGVIVSDYPNSD